METHCAGRASGYGKASVLTLSYFLFFRKPFFTDYARITVKADICNPLRYLPDSVKRFPLALFEFHFDNIPQNIHRNDRYQYNSPPAHQTEAFP